MNRHPLVFMLVGCLVIGGCAGLSPTQVGQTTGSIAGGAIAPGIGAPIGALVGTLAGLVIEHQMDKVREQRERVELTQALKTAKPAEQALDELRPADGVPARVWVDETMKQGRLIAGHFESRAIP